MRRTRGVTPRRGHDPCPLVRPAGSVRSSARSDALICNGALVLKYAGGVESHSGAVLIRRPYQYRAARIETRRRADAARRSETAHPFPLVELDAFRWVYDPSEGMFRSEGNEDSTPAVRRKRWNLMLALVVR